MKYYAIVGVDGYCTHIMNCDEMPQIENVVIVELEEVESVEYYLNRMYDVDNATWLDEVYTPPIVPRPLTEHEQLTKDTYGNVEATSYDNLTNMDMLIGLDEKLNVIMEHLGLTL